MISSIFFPIFHNKYKESVKQFFQNFMFHEKNQCISHGPWSRTDPKNGNNHKMNGQIFSNNDVFSLFLFKIEKHMTKTIYSGQVSMIHYIYLQILFFVFLIGFLFDCLILLLLSLNVFIPQFLFFVTSQKSSTWTSHTP